MTIHTHVKSIGGTLFSFYMEINLISHFLSSLSHFLLCAMGHSALDKLNYNFFYSTSNDNTYTREVHMWYTFFVLHVN